MEIENIKFNKVELAINNLKEEVSKNNEIYFAKIESLKAEIKVLKIPKGQNKNDDLLLQPLEKNLKGIQNTIQNLENELTKQSQFQNELEKQLEKQIEEQKITNNVLVTKKSLNSIPEIIRKSKQNASEIDKNASMSSFQLFSVIFKFS